MTKTYEYIYNQIDEMEALLKNQVVNVSSCEEIRFETDNLFGSLLEKASTTPKGKVVYLPMDLRFGEDDRK